MIWYFLAGAIAGVVGTVKYSRWWVRRHMVIVKNSANMEEKTDE